MILLKNGRVVDPLTDTDKILDVLIDGDKIAEVREDITEENADVIDCTGLVIAPGLVDAHVHFRDPGFTHKEDIITGANSAKKGGFTTVICMANTNPPVDNKEVLDYIYTKAEKTGIRVLQCACVTKGMKGKELCDFEALKQCGAVGFTDDGLPVTDESILLKALEIAKELDMPVSLHEEDPLFIEAPGVNKGKVSEKLCYGGASRTAEDIMTARDCMLALHTGAKVCIQHISSKNSVALVRLSKSLGAKVYAEATPHHFTLTEEAVLEYGTNARMNPPLRTEEDRLAVIEGIKDGTIDMIVTDHAPHSDEEKQRPMDKAPSGIIGLETSLALGIKTLVQGGHISLMKLLELMSVAPLKLYGIEPNAVAAGERADLVIFGENEIQKVEKFESKAANSPFKGWELPGKVHYTIANGKIVYSI